MDLREFFSILFIALISLNLSIGQETQVKCINPEFEEVVEDYLQFSVPTITVADAYSLKDEYTFLDAREIEEFKTSHIEGSIHVGYDNFDIRQIKNKVKTDEPIIIYCSIGYRSEIIGKKLMEEGYTNVLNLYGSIFEWVNQHRPIYDSDGKITQIIHTYNKSWSKWVGNEETTKIWKP